jgi:hypothetical protein
VPEIEIFETFTGADPLFVIVTLCILVFPTVTFPKLTLVELDESIPSLAPGFPELALVRPTQLDSPSVERIRLSVKMAAKGFCGREVECSP